MQQRAMKDIQKIKSKNARRHEQEQLEKDINKVKEDRQRTLARKKVEQRMVQLGLGHKIGSNGAYQSHETMGKKPRGVSAENRSKAYRIVDIGTDRLPGTEANSMIQGYQPNRGYGGYN
jgi:hypothetical protein